MTAAERRLKERLASFFADRAQHVSRQISAHLGHDVLSRDDAIVRIEERAAWRDIARSILKGSDHPDLHVKPENAIPIGLPVADVVTRANVQHVSWELVREGKAKTKRRILPIDDLIATQQVLDKKRVAKHEKMLAETGELEKEGAILVLEWDGDLFMLGGHHGTQAAKNLGWAEVPADVMSAD
jgi:hypothetical protein